MEWGQTHGAGPQAEHEGCSTGMRYRTGTQDTGIRHRTGAGGGHRHKLGPSGLTQPSGCPHSCPHHQRCPLPTDAPWCGHCQRLAPAFAQAAAELRNESSPARLGKVDATAQTALATEFGITSYPTLKLFRDGNRTHPLAYTGRAAAPRSVPGTQRRGHCHGAGVGGRVGG